MSEDALLSVLRQQPSLVRLMDALASDPLPGWYVGAGIIYQTWWNHRSGQPLDAWIDDVDLVYFDPNDLEASAEAQIQARLAALTAPLPLDVNNQARVHRWYPAVFGKEIPPYTSTEAAIATWPTTASSIGLTVRDGAWKLCAPFGLDDLLNMIARPNPVLIPRAVYEKKVARWSRCWPNLTVLPWAQYRRTIS
ncbi:MAG: hypothetical protein ACI8RZ_006723 [Myxococcota bacterium]